MHFRRSHRRDFYEPPDAPKPKPAIGHSDSKMPPRFIERLERQSRVYRKVFGEPQFDPPPYPTSANSSIASTTAAVEGKENKPSSSSSSAPPQPPPQYHQLGYVPGREGLDAHALAPDSLILVTGASGWQGIHVVDHLLQRGFRVRGAVRTAEKAVATSKSFKKKYGIGRFTTAVIPDMAVKGAFDLAVRGCSGLIHCASVTTFSPDPQAVITPSIAGAINALEAARKEPNMRRFVLCSSVAAAVSSGNSVRQEVTSESWNMAAFKSAWQPPPYEIDRSWAVYSASKLQTEQAVWRWYHEQRPDFVLNSVLPGMLFGRMLDADVHRPLPPSIDLLRLVLDGNAAATAASPAQAFADVQDAALLHVAALTLPDVRGQRIFAATESYNINGLLVRLRARFPALVLPGDVSDHGVDLSVFVERDAARSLLRRMGREAWTDLETSVARTCEALLAQAT